MREIKFRAYLKDTNEMVTVGAMDWDHEGNLLCLNYPKGKDYFGYEDDIALMQYTGYEDVFGNEIYEGDVVRFDRKLFEVRWMFSGFYANADDDYVPIATNEEDMEVVGNIYESPDLIKLIYQLNER